MKKIIFTTALILLGSLTLVNAVENVGSGHHRNAAPKSTAASGCNPATAQTDLDINNVRAKILNGGDMWWDLISARYEVPKGSSKFSLFAGSIWIGGIDAGGQLKVAAMTYRQTGNDFWPGPVNANTTTVEASVCTKYDKHWKITRQQVQDFSNWYCNPNAYPSYGTPPLAITGWPGNSEYGSGQTLAPFFDNNGDGVYDYTTGDYPNYNITNCNNTALTGCPPNAPNSCFPAHDYLYGDQTLWWVFNDVGNIHSETGGQPIGLEIQAQAFAFQTGDEINNCTFYQYKIINRSTFTVNDTYIGQWVDADLGNYTDDYVGCDVSRGLGFCYNGNPCDNGATGYGCNPPAVGVDFFQGPIADQHDGIDNNKNGHIDEACEQIIMSKFVYYNNDGSLQGNPSNGTQYYGYLKGLWRDGTSMTFGGNGYGGSTPCNYMFPDNSDDAYGWGLGGTTANPVVVPKHWTESEAGDLPGDRRFLQSAGKFSLKPGALNIVTTGVVWARATQGGPTASVTQLKLADDKAQSLFDNCFAVLNGPDAPDMAVRELDREIIISLSNVASSNNYKEQYKEKDPTIICDATNPNCDQYYHFEGYQVFQLHDATVTYSDIFNPLTGGYNTDKGRLVAQCDVKNGISQLINFYLDPTLNALVPVSVVDGKDAGISHTFKFTNDAFTGTTLINHLPYYYTVVAYGHNNYKTFTPTDPNALDGQKKPYFAGRLNVKTYSAIPHIPSIENGGQTLNSDYGDGPMLTRIQGQGNGGMILEMTEQSINEIMNSASNRSLNPVYKNGAGPVNIKVYDPVAVPKGNFEITIGDTAVPLTLWGAVSLNANWKLINLDTKETVNSETTIAIGNEQVVPKWGFSLNIAQVPTHTNGLNQSLNNGGFLEASIKFDDSTKAWLTGIQDQDGIANPFNWIHSGMYAPCSGTPNLQDFDALYNPCPNPTFVDSFQNYEKIIGGTWAPYRLVDTNTFYKGYPASLSFGGPGLGNSLPIASSAQRLAQIDSLASVDLFITSDKSKWTRCPVIETSDDVALAEGKAPKLLKRAHASVDKNGNSKANVDINHATNVGSTINGLTDPSDPNYIDSIGMGWFPGYAINLETGERMNIIFGEDSWLAGDNGKDMLWNPTSNYADNSSFIFGGRHYIYLMHGKSGPAANMPYTDGIYDGGRFYDSLLNSIGKTYGNTNSILRLWREAMWVNMPMLIEGQKLLSTNVKIRLRVAKPYKPYDTATVTKVNNNQPIYTFNSGDIYADKNEPNIAKSACDLMNVVPNPYYAFSAYEANQLANTVYITNLPSRCTVTIYSLNGTLIRQFNRDVAVDNSAGASTDAANPETSLAWDLKNSMGIPVASGLYLIHIKSDQCEKTLKWFGVMRPLDLDTF